MFDKENQFSVRITFDDQIQFEEVSSPREILEDDNLDLLEEIIQDYFEENQVWPIQSRIVEKGKELGIAKNKIPNLLKEGKKEGRWETEPTGNKGAISYKIPVSQFPNTIGSQETGKQDEDTHESNVLSIPDEEVPWKNHSKS